MATCSTATIPQPRETRSRSLAPYAAIREMAGAIREGSDVDAADLAQAIADAREIYETLIDRVEGHAR